jgi:hypothetical protein
LILEAISVFSGKPLQVIGLDKHTSGVSRLTKRKYRGIISTLYLVAGLVVVSRNYTRKLQFSPVDFLSKFLYTNFLPGTLINGRLAQLGEHLPYKQGVTSSSLVPPTKYGTVV